MSVSSVKKRTTEKKNALTSNARSENVSLPRDLSHALLLKAKALAGLDGEEGEKLFRFYLKHQDFRI